MSREHPLSPEVHFARHDDDLSRDYWNPQRETMPADRMAALQFEKLKRQLDYLACHSDFYRTKFRDAGFDPGDLHRIEDLAALPFTTKAELREAQEAAPPFGSHQAAPMDRIVRITSTAGTTGRPVFQGYTREDTLRRNESIARGLWGFGVRPGDRVINGFALSMFNAGIPFCAAIEHLGALDVPVGAERKAEGMLRIAHEVKATVWIGTPSFAAYLAERCEDVLGIPPHELGLRVVCGGGESGFELPSFQKRMEEAFGTRHVYDWASTSDAHPNVFAHCRYRNGKHQLTPDFALVQLIDMASGEVKPMHDGAEGEYIFTHLDRQSCGLVRYRTGDILRVRTGACECGRTGFRMDIVGRADDMLLVRGVNVFPSALQSVVDRFAPKVAGRIQVVLPRPGPRVDPPVRMRVEHAQGLSEVELGTLKAAIEAAIRSDLSVTANVQLLSPGTVVRTETKTRFVVVEPQ
ncbi:MAG: phenylacetate--CoA ligase family protein [Lautropia sp.]